MKSITIKWLRRDLERIVCWCLNTIVKNGVIGILIRREDKGRGEVEIAEGLNIMKEKFCLIKLFFGG